MTDGTQQQFDALAAQPLHESAKGEFNRSRRIEVVEALIRAGRNFTDQQTAELIVQVLAVMDMEERVRAVMDVLYAAFETHSSIVYKNSIGEAWYEDGDTRIGGDTNVRCVALALVEAFWPDGLNQLDDV